jgi:hypothetical protein
MWLKKRGDEKCFCDPTFRSGCDERILSNCKVKRKSDEKSS